MINPLNAAVSHFRSIFSLSLLPFLSSIFRRFDRYRMPMTRKITLDYHNLHRSSSLSSSSNTSSSRYYTLWTMFKVLCFILLYWCCSISLTFFNRHLFQNSKFPLSITGFHMALKFLLATVIRSCLHRWSWTKCSNERERITLSWPILWRKVAPTGPYSDRVFQTIRFVF